MRTSICEGIGAFIVVEGWHLFLGAEVFSLWDSTWIVPNVINKIFPCREDLYLGIPWWLSVCRKYSPSSVFAVSIHNGPLHKLGLPFICPWTWIRQAHLIGPVKLYFYPLQYVKFVMSVKMAVLYCYLLRQDLNVVVIKKTYLPIYSMRKT